MKDPREEFIPAWPETAAPSAPYGGLLGPLAEPVVEPRNDPWLTTYAERPVVPLTPANLTGWWSTFLSPLPASGWNPSSPALQPAPIGTNAGFPAAPDRPVVEPWNDLRRVPLTALLPFALPATFSPVPPMKHLDSGQYWPFASAPSGANGQPPAHGFHSSPRLAPSWDAVPTLPIGTNTAQVFAAEPNLSGPNRAIVGASPLRQILGDCVGTVGRKRAPAHTRFLSVAGTARSGYQVGIVARDLERTADFSGSTALLGGVRAPG